MAERLDKAHDERTAERDHAEAALQAAQEALREYAKIAGNGSRRGTGDISGNNADVSSGVLIAAR